MWSNTCKVNNKIQRGIHPRTYRNGYLRVYRNIIIFGDQHSSSNAIDMPDRIPTSDQACCLPIRLVGLGSGMSVSDQVCRSPIRHVGLQSGMPVYFNGFPIRQVGLRLDMSVSNGFPMVLCYRSPMIFL